ncbi:MAG TPA: SCO family protein [Solirubrobacterales bacterium]|jgi:protein SCO1/2
MTDSARPPDRTRGIRLPIPFPAIAIVAVVGVATVLIATHHSSESLPGDVSSHSGSDLDGLALSPRKPAPSFGGLRNYLGEPVSLAAYRGKVVLVTFLYTHCPDVCPLITAELHNTLARLGPQRRRQVQIVAVSVDPHGDSREAVAAFVNDHGMTGRMKYLIGDTHELAPVWEAWNVGSEPDSVNPELVAHSALVYGVSADGLLTTIYPSNFKPSQIVHDLPKLLNE